MRTLRISAASAVLVLVAGAVAGLAGCASPTLSCKDNLLANTMVEETKATEVAVVLAPTDSFVDFPPLLAEFTPLVQDALGVKASRLSVILADGRPQKHVTSDIAEQGQSRPDIEKAVENSVVTLDYVYSCAVDPHGMTVTDSIHVDPEVNLIDSLRVAADSFDSSSPNSTKRIIVFSNGLQTEGQYKMQDEGIPSLGRVKAVIDQLAADGALPKLKGATVDFIGLGHVNSGASALNQQSIDSLEYFWTTLVQAANGQVGVIQREVGDNDGPSEKSIKTATVTRQPDACVSVVVTEDQGAEFQPGTAVFKDPSKAKAAAKDIVDQVKAKKKCTGTMTVTGYVASAVNKSEYEMGNAADAQLSKNRALAFRALLQSQGISVAVRAVGGGKGPYLDWDAHGVYSEKLGQKNRIVIVSQDAQ